MQTVNNVIVQHPENKVVHEIYGSAPGWALCSDWIPKTPALPEGTAVDCPGCRQSPEAAHTPSTITA